MDSRAIGEVIVGERMRKDMGDLKSLAESIETHGLLHPVVVGPDGVLIAGHRRLEAVKLLGWEAVPVTVVEVADLLAAERDENEVRKDFTPTEAVAIGRLIESAHRAKIAAQRGEVARRNVAHRSDRTGTTKDAAVTVQPVGPCNVVASKAVGYSQPTYERAKAIVAAAERDPERFGDLPERMDETGNVSGTHAEMKRREAAPKAKKPRHAALKHTHHPKPNREVERALVSLDGICDCLDAIAAESLDEAKTAQWAKAMKAFASRINCFARRING